MDINLSVAFVVALALTHPACPVVSFAVLLGCARTNQILRLIAFKEKL